ncbi:MAG: UPF0149 family protein [Pseudomonadales bacterium]
MTDLTALALNAAHQLPVAELHGAVCGLGVCHGEALPVHDLIELVGVDALTDQHAVDDFVAASVADLQAEDLSFAPLLPADDAPLDDRLEALGQWCGSFLAGLAAGLARRGTGSLDDCPDEVREIVRDLAAIAQVEAAQVEAADGATGAEAAETDFIELAEFVKVGALLIMSTFEHGSDDPAG